MFRVKKITPPLCGAPLQEANRISQTGAKAVIDRNKVFPVVKKIVNDINTKFPLVKGVANDSLTGVIPTNNTNTNLMEALSNLGIINANLKLKNRSKQMSRQMTKSEQIIWFSLLSKKQLLGYKFTKQKIIFNYILDFYCSELLLAVEIDGDSHNIKQEYDQVRTDFLNSIGIQVIRFTNQQVNNNLEGIKIQLENFIKQIAK
jgi:very-short-patch-repair endonuclease